MAEILYRHAVQELGFSHEWKGKEEGDIDNVGKFLSELTELTKAEMKVVLEILVLATVLDGKVSRKERSLYDAAVEACAATPEVRHGVISSAMRRSLTSKRAPVPQGKDFMVHDNRVRELAQNYRKMEVRFNSNLIQF